MSLFDVDGPYGQSAVRVDEHVGGLGQTAMFGSDLALGEDDAELARKDAQSAMRRKWTRRWSASLASTAR